MNTSVINMHAPLGHPSDMDAAQRRFAAAIQEAAQQKDPQSLRRTLAKSLIELTDRIENTASLTDTFRSTVKGVEEKAQWDILSEYQVRTANAMYDFAGIVLATIAAVEEGSAA